MGMKFSTRDDAKRAIAASVEVFKTTHLLAAFERHAVLSRVSEGLGTEREDFAQLICDEAKKPIRDARVEVDRARLTFSLAAEEARRFGGELLPLDLSAAAAGRLGLVRRFPLGPVAAVTPFNFPLNLVAHKLAPAIAVGAPVVLKPAEKTPQVALKLQALVHASGWPEAAFAVLTPETPQEIGHLLAEDPRLPVFSFTGSDTVGWALKLRANQKQVTLELGGNAAVLVAEDADIAHAVARCTVGGFSYSGQVCISVQRVFVAKRHFSAFCAALVEKVRSLRLGDPSEETTDMGPLITEAAAIRVEQWIQQAKGAGAKLLLDGRRDGAFLSPSILTDVPVNQPLVGDEVFGPVVVVEPVTSFDEGIARINASRYGLQAGVFTYDIRRVLQAHGELTVGGVILNDVPTFRSDAMPYGGEGDSGMGREGIRWTMNEYTNPRVLVL